MVVACESMFSRTSLGARPQNLHTFSKVNPKYLQHTCPVGQVRYSVHLPFSSNLQILLAQGNGASTNVEPCEVIGSGHISLFNYCSLVFPLSLFFRSLGRILRVSSVQSIAARTYGSIAGNSNILKLHERGIFQTVYPEER